MCVQLRGLACAFGTWIALHVFDISLVVLARHDLIFHSPTPVANSDCQFRLPITLAMPLHIFASHDPFRYAMLYGSNGLCIRIVSSRSGLVESKATGQPTNSSMRRTYLIAAAGSCAHERARAVGSCQPATVS